MPLYRTFVVALLTFAASAFAAESTPATRPSVPAGTISVADTDALKDAVGKKVKVSGTIKKAYWIKSGKVMFITFRGTDASGFEAVAFPSIKDELDKKFDGDAATTLTDKKVIISGKVAMHAQSKKSAEEHPQIVINEASQIELNEEKK